MKTKTTLTIITLAAIALTARAQVFDPAAVFSPTNNPNGVWSYGWAFSLETSFTLHTNTGGFDQVNPALQSWYTDLSLNEPSVTYNASETNITVATATWQPRQFSLHPGPDTQLGILRWTAPATANYSVTASFTQVDNRATVDVHVLQSGTNLFTAALDASHTTAAYSATRFAEAGDTLDFAVGNGGDTFFGDRTGLALVIARVPLVTSLRYSQVEFCWNSVPGRMYQVQYRSDLTANAWVDLGPLVSGSGSTNCITDAIAQGDPQRFYQVVEQP